MRSTVSSSFVPVVHSVAKATIRSCCRTSASGKRRTYSGAKRPREKRFSRVCLAASQSFETRVSSARWASLAPAAQARACLPLQGEARQRHAGLLPQLEEGESLLQVERQVMTADLVEHRP